MKKNNQKSKNKSTPKFLRDKIQSIYNRVDLRTTCPGHCTCCHVACPQMNNSEFLTIAEYIYKSFDIKMRSEFLKRSIVYFFSSSLVKPCMMLNDKKCSIYEDRPLNCRMYGLWPEDLYNERVERFSVNTGLKKEAIPLNTQCKFVKRVNDSQPLTRDVVEDLYEALNDLDMKVGGFKKEQIESRYNVRTWHDWFMVTVFGEEKLEAMSNFLLAAQTQEAVDEFVSLLCQQVDQVGESLWKKVK